MHVVLVTLAEQLLVADELACNWVKSDSWLCSGYFGWKDKIRGDWGLDSIVLHCFLL